MSADGPMLTQHRVAEPWLQTMLWFHVKHTLPNGTSTRRHRVRGTDDRRYARPACPR